MDGKNRLDGFAVVAEQQGKDGRLPIVAVDDIVFVVPRDEGVDRHHEAGEALVVVAIAVHAVSVEAVHGREVVVDVLDTMVEDAATLGPPSHFEVEGIIEVGKDLLMLVADGLVERDDDGNIDALVLERLSEGGR